MLIVLEVKYYGDSIEYGRPRSHQTYQGKNYSTPIMTLVALNTA